MDSIDRSVNGDVMPTPVPNQHSVNADNYGVVIKHTEAVSEDVEVEEPKGGLDVALGRVPIPETGSKVCYYLIKLGDNCIQNFHLGRYIVGYSVGNLVLRRRVSGAVNVISERISDDIPPQM